MLHRCYRKLWSGKRSTSSAGSQTEPEFTFNKEENLLDRTLLKHQPEQVELPKMPKKKCIKEPVKEEPLSKIQNPLYEDSSLQAGSLPGQSKQLPSSPKFSPPTAADSHKQVSGINNTRETCAAEYNQPDKVNGNGERLEDTQTKNSELCSARKTDTEDDIVLMKLKNESQVNNRPSKLCRF